MTPLPSSLAWMWTLNQPYHTYHHRRPPHLQGLAANSKPTPSPNLSNPPNQPRSQPPTMPPMPPKPPLAPTQEFLSTYIGPGSTNQKLEPTSLQPNPPNPPNTANMRSSAEPPIAPTQEPLSTYI